MRFWETVSHYRLKQSAWSKDGETLSFTVLSSNGSAIWTYSPKEKKARVFAQVPGKWLSSSMFSPDGHWLAYQSSESISDAGQFEIFVQPFPATGTKYQISKNTGHYVPLWSPDGKELFYSAGSGEGTRFVGTGIATRPVFSYGNPKPMSQLERMVPEEGGARNYDIMPDGKRFLTVLNQQQQTPSAPQIRVVINWFSELQERVPVK